MGKVSKMLVVLVASTMFFNEISGHDVIQHVQNAFVVTSKILSKDRPHDEYFHLIDEEKEEYPRIIYVLKD